MLYVELSQDLLLDPLLRDWALIPIVLVMLLVGILRSNLSTIITGASATKDLEKAKEQNVLARLRRFRQNCSKLPPRSFHQRREYYTETLLSDMGKSEPQVGPMMDTNNMTTMLKKNLAFGVSQILLFNWVSYFFSGFVLVKMPFPLTLAFKPMLQKGIDLSYLDTRYVSSLSWYVMNLFGLRGIHSIILGDGYAASEDPMMQQQMMMPAQPQQQDMSKVFKGEKEELQLLHHHFTVSASRELLLKS